MFIAISSMHHCEVKVPLILCGWLRLMVIGLRLPITGRSNAVYERF